MQKVVFKGIYTAQIAQFQLLFFIPLYIVILLYLKLYIEILLYNKYII
jgi:hypothetical protein